MKRNGIWLIGLATMALPSGCATNTGTGALAGGGIGAATGALVGSATGRPGAGALIGAGVGAATGGLVGNAMDKQEQRHQREIQQASAVGHTGPLSIQDVVNMSRSGVSDDVIHAQMRSSQSVFNLAPNDVIRLQQEGVSDSVVKAMMDTPRRQVVVRHPAPVVVYEACPPPPVHVGFGYHSYGRRHW